MHCIIVECSDVFMTILQCKVPSTSKGNFKTKRTKYALLIFTGRWMYHSNEPLDFKKGTEFLN
jgi:hypothetical protein